MQSRPKVDFIPDDFRLGKRLAPWTMDPHAPAMQRFAVDTDYPQLAVPAGYSIIEQPTSHQYPICVQRQPTMMVQ